MRYSNGAGCLKAARGKSADRGEEGVIRRDTPKGMTELDTMRYDIETLVSLRKYPCRSIALYSVLM